MSIFANVFEDAFSNAFVQQQELPTYEDILGYSLYPVQEKWIKHCFENDKRVSVLLCSRRYGKTDIIVIACITLMLLKNPNLKFLIATKVESRTHDLIETIGYQLQRYGKKGKFASRKIQLNENKFDKQPSVSAVTPKASKSKGNHVDFLICDDIVADNDEGSKKELARSINFYYEIFNLANKIIILGQRVHEQDLYSVLNEAAANIDDEDTSVSILRNFNGSIPKLDANIEELRKAKVSERSIQKNYFDNLILDGLYPFSELITQEFDFKEGVNTYACIDPAFDGGDKIGLSIGYVYNDIFCTKVFAIDGNVFDNKHKIMQIMNKHKVVFCYIESNDNGGVLRDYAYNNSFNTQNIIFKGFREKTKKSVRIKSRIGSVIDKLVVSGDFQHVLTWTENEKHDDVPDSLASLINFLKFNPEKIKVYGSYGRF